MKLEMTYLFVILLMLPKFGFTPRKVVNKVSCGGFFLSVRKALVF